LYNIVFKIRVLVFKWASAPFAPRINRTLTTFMTRNCGTTSEEDGKQKSKRNYIKISVKKHRFSIIKGKLNKKRLSDTDGAVIMHRFGRELY